MFIKTKKVQLKNGIIREYYYLAESIRINGQPVPKIIKYLGKTIPECYAHLRQAHYTINREYPLRKLITTAV